MPPEREPYARIVVGIVLLAILPPIAISHFGPDNWFVNLQNWQSGLGGYWGALFGLGAILFGALVNADLNRKRDDRLRDEETRGHAAALAAELRTTISICKAFVGASSEIAEAIATDIENELTDPHDTAAVVGIPTFPVIEVPIFRMICGQIGMFGPKIARQICLVFDRLAEYQRLERELDKTARTPEKMAHWLPVYISEVSKDAEFSEYMETVLIAYAESGKAAALIALEQISKKHGYTR